MKKGIIEASELPENEKVYLKKDFLGWRVVEPLTNPDGTKNWFRIIFGSKRTALFLLIILVIGMLVYAGYNETLESSRKIVANPCRFCPSCFYKSLDNLSGINITITNQDYEVEVINNEPR